MAQHDYSIANQSGAAFRSDLNNALSAIVTINSGTAEPSTTYAYMLWADTTNGVLKMRNAANNAWITLRELDGTLIIESGTAAAPSLYFSGDANTGFYSPSADVLAVATGGTERIRFDSSGNVGIGRAPTYALDVYRASGDTRIVCDSDSLANNETASFEAYGGTRVSAIGVIKHSGITNPCSYVFLKEEDDGSNYLWVDNSSQLRISSASGHVGTTSGTVVGAQTSDERLKNILGPVEYGLDTLKQIEPVRYALKTEPTVEKLGFIAQQVLPIVPQSVFDTGEIIREGEPTKLGMEYVALIPVLVNAVKELSAKNDALEARLAALEAE